VPILERFRDDGDRGAGDDELAVLAGQSAARRIPGDRLLHAGIDAGEHHRLIACFCGYRPDRLERSEQPDTPGRAQDVAPVETSGKKIAATCATSKPVWLSHVYPLGLRASPHSASRCIVPLLGETDCVRNRSD
jgi:hypothetical protein